MSILLALVLILTTSLIIMEPIFITQEEYPESRLPTFVLGPAYILTRKACKRLWENLTYVPFVWLEDVFLTGLVAHYAGVPRVKTPIFQRRFSLSFYNGSSVFMKEGHRTDKDKAFAFVASLMKPKSSSGALNSSRKIQ